MEKTKFLRAMALVLAMIFVFAGGATVVSADASSPSDSISDATTSDIQELLNTITYEKYSENNSKVGAADKAIILSAIENYEYLLKDGTVPAATVKDQAEVRKYPVLDSEGKPVIGEDGEPLMQEGLYVPSTGMVTWTLSEEFLKAEGLIDKDGNKLSKKYTFSIEYYPVRNKSTSIERVLLVNGEVPFAEARQMLIEKVWVVSEPFCDFNIGDANGDGKILAKDREVAESEIEGLIAAAKEKGLKAEIAVKSMGDDDDETEDKKTEKVKVFRYTMPEVWTAELVKYIEELGLRFFTVDIDKNEIRSNSTDVPDWYEYTFKDSNGYMQYPFEVVLTPDKNGELKISLRSENEPMVISKITLGVPKKAMSYEKYLEGHKNDPRGDGQMKLDSVKLEAEYFSAASSQTIYPISDSTSAVNSPVATNRTLLNAIGGDKWQTAGQWIEYDFTVTKSGMYKIIPRFKQNILDGMYVSRALYIYGGEYNGLPFDEAGRLKFNYSSEWQAAPLSDGTTEFEFYFEEGVTYTLRFEVNLGQMGDVVRGVQQSLNAINKDYLEIMKLTGPTPDEFRDYGFYRVMPQTVNDLNTQRLALKAIKEAIEDSVVDKKSKKSSNTATLEKVEMTLEKMFFDEDEIAKNLEQLKTHIGSLGTWLSDAKTQPLTVDYICIQGAAEEEMPKARAGFFQSIWHEIVGFIQSFWRNYDRMGAMSETAEEETVEVWLAYGRDQSQVIRGLINNDFTYNTGIPVNLKLVSGGTLLPSILSKQGPDVYIGLGQADVINYAIRGALISIDDLYDHEDYWNHDAKGERTTYNEAKFKDEFQQTIEQYKAEYVDSRKDFNDAAMIVLEIENSEGELHCYGLPETQSFSMMFVREDILAELNLNIPKTWDDVKAAIPVLQANNMQIGMHNDMKIFLYQNGGELFADDGMRINLDSNVALDSFAVMCDFFTMYSFPYKYDFANRFRTGEMPIGFATYTATYNQLKVFATEIEGLWSFYPMPGVMDKNGNINNASVSAVSAIVMITDCQNKHDAWEFMRWHCDDKCQIDYSNEMVAILGPSAKHATANWSALESMPWTVDEIEQIKYQFNNLASIPNYPGCYIVDRYLKFAFLDAYDKNLDPAKSLEGYVAIINKEIDRKREEFRLETLDYERDGRNYLCPTLANKRLREAEDALNLMKETSQYNASFDSVYKNIMKLIRTYETEDYASLNAFADELERLTNARKAEVPATETVSYEQYETAIKCLRDAARSLEIYETYK